MAQSLDKGSYSLSLGSTTANGIVPSTGMDRYNAKLTAQAQLNKNWSTGFNGNFVYSKIKSKPVPTMVSWQLYMVHRPATI